MEAQIIQDSMNILLPVMESAIVLAGEYSKKCSRTVLTSHDMKYAVRYCVRNVTGKHIGTLFPEIDEDDDDEEIETVDEDDEPFTRYSGSDQLMNEVNEAHDTWEMWEPETPIESMLKDAIDKNVY
jgi:hypothetical protein